jgi:hypothetical protein
MVVAEAVDVVVVAAAVDVAAVAAEAAVAAVAAAAVVSEAAAYRGASAVFADPRRALLGIDKRRLFWPGSEATRPILRTIGIVALARPNSLTTADLLPTPCGPLHPEAFGSLAARRWRRTWLVVVQRPQHGNAGHHKHAARLGGRDQKFHGNLPVLALGSGTAPGCK